MISRRRFLKAFTLTASTIMNGCSTPSTENVEISNAPLDAGSLKNALKDLHLSGQRITFDLPLLARLYDLNAEIAIKFPSRADPGIGQMGLLLNHRFERGGYWCTPINSLSFGSTGGDGAHFSFLILNNEITDNTPVIISVPDNFGCPENANVVLSRNFVDFVRLGLHCGYFSMAQFAFDAEDALKHYSRTDWEDSGSWFPSDNHRVVAEFIATRLNLKRLAYSSDEFAELQAQFKPLLRFKKVG